MNLQELLNSLTNKELTAATREYSAISCMSSPANVKRSEMLDALFGLTDLSFKGTFMGRWMILGEAITSQVMRRFLDGVVA